MGFATLGMPQLAYHHHGSSQILLLRRALILGPPNDTGTDSGNTYGTPDNPRATIPRPIPAGSYVEIHGRYDYLTAGAIFVEARGTAENPVWIVGIQGDEPTFVGGKLFLYGSYCYVENVKGTFTANGQTFQIGTPSSGYQTDYIMLRNSEIWGDGATKTGGISIAGSSINHISNVIIYNNYLHDIGDTSATVDQDAHALTCMQYVNNVWIVDNLIAYAGGTGIALGGYSGSQPYTDSHHFYVSRNEVHHTLQAGIATKMSNFVVISQNVIHDIINTSWSPSKGVGVQYRPHNTWVIYNRIYNARYGVRAASTYAGVEWNLFVIGNEIFDINIDGKYNPNDTWAEAAIMLVGTENRYVVNNSIYNCYAGINATGGAGRSIIENNIVSDIISGNHIWAYFTANSIVRNNITHQSAGIEKIKWGSTVYSLAEFNSVTGQGSNSSTLYPLFVDSNNDDFNVMATSPAIDAGLNNNQLSTDVYTLYESTFGVKINVDAIGLARPQGDLWDIGAIEYSELQIPTPISPIIKRIEIQ